MLKCGPHGIAGVLKGWASLIYIGIHEREGKKELQTGQYHTDLPNGLGVISAIDRDIL